MSFKQSVSKMWAEPAGKALVGASAILILTTSAVVSSKSPNTVPGTPATAAVTAPEEPPAESDGPNTSFSTAHAWNSQYNTEALENSIKYETANSHTGVAQSISSASCKATEQQNIFHCNVRRLGEPEPTTQRVEVDVPGDNWASQSL